MFRSLSLYVLFYVWAVMRAYISTSTSTTTHVSLQYCVFYCYNSTLLWNSFLCGLSPITHLCLHHLQSSEHFQAGHAPPAHPVPRGLCVHEEAVRAVFSPERAQSSAAQQGPLQSGLSAFRGQVQFDWRVNNWIWRPAGLQQHVGVPFSFHSFAWCVDIQIQCQRKHIWLQFQLSISSFITKKNYIYIFMRKVEWVKFLWFIHCVHIHHEANEIYMVNLFCSHQGFLAGSTPEPNRRYSTMAHNLVSRTSSAPSPSLQRRISTNTSSSFYLKNKGRRFNVQLKKGEENRWIAVIGTLW